VGFLRREVGGSLDASSARVLADCSQFVASGASAKEEEQTMSLKAWEKKVLAKRGAVERVAEIEDELRVAARLTLLRKQEGLSQRALAKRLGVSQPRIAAIEQSRNVTLDVLGQYAGALGGHLEVTVVKGTRRIPLVEAKKNVKKAAAKKATASKKKAAAKATKSMKHAKARKAAAKAPAKRVRAPA
jgi:transcriptional regulator with XRE-family HTH domain